jgi:hypothetical protein
MAVADIFKEVDEDLRRDQAEKLWRKYGAYVIAAAAAVVLATAGFQTWKWWYSKQQTELSDRYAAAVRLIARGDNEAAADQFGALADPGGGYGTLAAFNQARLLAASGDKAAAIEIWDRLAASSAAGPAFQGVATLLSVMQQMEDGDPVALEARLKPLSETDGGYRHVALELIATLAIRQGDPARAREIYTQIADDPNSPVGLRARASQLLNALEE